MPLQERIDWAAKGRGLIIGTETAFDDAMQEAQAVRPLASGTNTVFMDFTSSADMNLEIVGVALLDMPWHGIIDGYTIDLLPNGEWGFELVKPSCEPEVQAEGVSVIAMSSQVSHNGRQIS